MSKDKKRATITACMMVKNGGDLFVQALESIRGVVDELVLVNTDTERFTPDTEAAKVFSDHAKVQIIHEPWARDFSKHRNTSLSAATSDWVLILDHDEKLVLPGPDGAQLLRKKLAKLGPEYGAVACTVEDYRGGQPGPVTTGVRLFRRGKVSYRRRIHNSPEYEGKLHFLTDVKVHHFGYGLSPELMRAKYERTHGMLLEELAEHPEDKELLFLLLQIAGEHGFDQEAAEWGEKYLACRDELGETFNRAAYFTTSRRYAKLGNHERAFEIVQMGLEEDPHNLDLALAMSEHGAKTQQSGLVAEGARRFVLGYQELQADPRKRGAAFVFSMRPEFYMIQLFRLATVSMAEGIGALQALAPFFDQQPKLRKDTDTFLEALGLGGLRNRMAWGPRR